MAKIMKSRKKGCDAAVPVFDRFGVVIAGLSISFPTLRFSEERLQEYVAMLHTAARKFLPKWVITTIRSDESKNLSEYQTDRFFI